MVKLQNPPQQFWNKIDLIKNLPPIIILIYINLVEYNICASPNIAECYKFM